jgi:polyhydroxyalkanoate synthesis regulator phasin|nr:MAG TPA: hypothetical protein [Bacteriophage sp.]
MTGLIGAIITGVMSFAGVLVTNIFSNRKVVNDIKNETQKNQAVTDTKIEELTREVREHNNFARRIPVVEEQIKNIDLRLSKLEGRD